MFHTSFVTRTLQSVLAITLGAAVTSTQGASRADEPPPLPSEAYAACDSKADGDTCTVHFHDRELRGTCALSGNGGRLFCRPSGPPPGPHNTSPRAI